MTTQPTLEALIRGIVREMLAGDGAGQNETQPKPGTLCLRDARLITVADLEGRLDGMTEVAAGTGAVVTPAAKDLLREQGIQLSRTGDAETTIHKTTEDKAIRIADVDSSDRAASFAKQLGLRSDSTIEVASAEVASIVLADVPQKIVCDLCGSGKLAAQVGSIDEVRSVAEAMQPTVWVLDMKRLNLIAAVNVAVRL